MDPHGFGARCCCRAAVAALRCSGRPGRSERACNCQLESTRNEKLISRHGKVAGEPVVEWHEATPVQGRRDASL